MLSSWIPCEDLAIDLRVRLGDWFRVIQLAHGANEEPAKRQWGVGDVLQRAGGKEDETFLRKTLFVVESKRVAKKMWMMSREDFSKIVLSTFIYHQKPPKASYGNQNSP